MERLSFKNGFFITLTYNNESLPVDGGVSYKDAKYFLDELRKSVRLFGFSYYFMSEYGGRNKRPHYHMHLFTDAPLSTVRDSVSKLWKLGFIKIGRSTLKSVLYTSAFHLLPKEHIKTNYPKPNFHIMSNGLGRSWADKYGDFCLDYNCNTFTFDGWKFNLPPYVRNRIGLPGGDIRKLDLFSEFNSCIDDLHRRGFFGVDALEQWEVYKDLKNEQLLIKGLKYKL